jgi:hypothetical protein
MSKVLCINVVMLAGLVSAGSCASPRSAGRPSPQTPSEAGSVLGEAEITRAGARTAYDAIRRLRPEYLAFTRRNGSSDKLVVYVDGIRIGTTEDLHTISSTSLREVRRLAAREATTRFGTGHSGGAIVILTKSGR